jgi:hypothetical protein
VAYFLAHNQQEYREYTHKLKEQWLKEQEEESKKKNKSIFEWKHHLPATLNLFNYQMNIICCLFLPEAGALMPAQSGMMWQENKMINFRTFWRVAILFLF